jgi:hypothetical protein
VKTKLTVFFEYPFWVGVFEREYDNKYEVSKIVFGSEPKDYDVYEYVLNNISKLKYSRPATIEESSVKKPNYKKMQKKIKKQLQNNEIGTKAQQAIKRERELLKKENVTITKEQKEIRKKMKYKMYQEKKKEKKKGH